MNAGGDRNETLLCRHDYDKRPDPDYGTGAIVNVAKVSPMPKAGGRWNIMEITAKGPHLIVACSTEPAPARLRTPSMRVGRSRFSIPPAS